MTYAEKYNLIRKEAAIKLKQAANRPRKKPKITIDPEFVVEMWKKQRGTCKYFNVKMHPSSMKEKDNNKGGSDPFVFTIDRKDPKGGYVPDNVHLVCWAANRMKDKEHHKSFLKTVKVVKEKIYEDFNT